MSAVANRKAAFSAAAVAVASPAPAPARTSSTVSSSTSNFKSSSSSSSAQSPAVSKLHNFGLISPVSVLVAVAFLALLINNISIIPSLTGPPSSNKPYRYFNDFYPFYRSEHSDQINRSLHLIGTTIIIILMILHTNIVIAQLAACSVGYIFCSLFQGFSYGIGEFVIMFLVYTLTIKLISGKFQTIPLVVPFIGYTFAWFGHFLFEHNRPATFIYPSYSLMGDYFMWLRCATGYESI
jgi:hypothetical protein